LAEAETSRRRSRETALREGNRPNLQLASCAGAWARRSQATLAQVHLALGQLALRQAEQARRTTFFVWLWRLVSAEKAPIDVAQAEIDDALALHTDWSAALRLRAQLLSIQGKAQESLDAVRALQDQDPADIANYQLLAQLLEKRWRELRGRPGQEGQAREVLAQIREQYQLLIDRGLAPAQGYLGLAQIAQEAGETEAARQAYVQAIAADPQFAEAYLRLGQLEKDLGEETAALEHLRKAAELAGGRSWIRALAHTHRGEILLEQWLRSEDETVRTERRKEARAAFEAALSEFPGMASARNGLGRIAYEEGDLSGAERLFLQVLEKDRNNFGALYGLGRVYEARSRSDIALRYFRRAVASRGESVAAHYHLGVTAFAQMSEAEARQALEWVRDRCQGAQPVSFDDRQACQGVAGWLERLTSHP
ncbi:MAG: tetratricopeptide repeat protein, partial [Chloroflexia bacterium]